MPVLSDIIIDRVRQIGLLTAFQIPEWLLTFTLTGSPTALRDMAEFLVPLNAVNLGDAESGFLYPKLPVHSAPNVVAALIGRVLAAAEIYGVEVCAVDADTSADVAASQFEALIDF